MSRRPASVLGTARLAIVGAEAPQGTLLREELASLKVPGDRVNLFAIATGEAVISEYAGEARLIQEPDLSEIASHDVIFLCEGGELADRVIRAAPESPVIDLAECLRDSSKPRLVHPAINPDEIGDGRGFFAVPEPMGLFVAELLHDLDRQFGVDEGVATILRPAADFGEAGLDELRRQTVNLLNFAEMPKKTFGDQLAFNVLGGPRTASRDALAERVAVEAGRVLGWSDRRLAVSVITVPVFHGHCVRVRVRLSGGPAIDDVRDAMRVARFLDTSGDGLAATPVEVSGERRTALHSVEPDGLGGVWLAAVAGELGPRGVGLAVELAERLIES